MTKRNNLTFMAFTEDLTAKLTDVLSLTQTKYTGISPFIPPPPPHTHTHTHTHTTSLTLVGALAHRAEVLSSSINESGKRIHVSLAAVATNGPPWSVIYQSKSVLKIGGRWERRKRRRGRRKKRRGEGKKGKWKGEKRREGRGEKREERDEGGGMSPRCLQLPVNHCQPTCILLTSCRGMSASGWMTSPMGTRQPLRRSLEQGTEYMVARM